MNRKIVLGIAAVVVAIPVVGIAYWLISPLFIDEVVDEEFAYSVNAEIPDDMTPQEVEDEMRIMAEGEDTSIDEEMPAGMKDMPQEEQIALRVLTGEFMDQDAVHRGEGTANVFQLPDGSHVLRFENFRVTNGPALVVLLDFSEDMSDTRKIGDLKGNVGSQNYTLPDDVNPQDIQRVIIYCEPFRVVFSIAEMST